MAWRSPIAGLTLARRLVGRFRQPLQPGPAGPAALAHQVQKPLHPRVGLDSKCVQKVKREIVMRRVAEVGLAGGVCLLGQVGRSISSRRRLSIFWIVSAMVDALASSIWP